MISTNLQHHNIIVIGAGISGLTAALRLKREGRDVLLLERDTNVGGCMQTNEQDGFLLEQGPFNVIVRDNSFNELIHSLTGRVEVVAPDDPKQPRYVFRNGRIQEVPSNPIALMTSPLLSAGARFRLLRGMLRSQPGDGTECTIHDAAKRRLGLEAADTLVSALVSGIYAGDSARLSLKAVFGIAHEIDTEARSILLTAISKMRAAKRAKAQADPNALAKTKGLISFAGGLGAFCNAMGAEIGDGLRTGVTVQSINYDEQKELYRIEAVDTQGLTTQYTCQELVLATPKNATGQMLHTIAPDAGHLISSIAGESIIILNLGYQADQFEKPLHGYGFLVPRNEPDFPLLGTLFASSVFPQGAPAGHSLLRVFMGGARDRQAIDCDDETLLATATAAVQEYLGATGTPMLTNICRYRDAIPQLQIGHGQLMKKVAEEIAHHPRLHLIGNYLTGVSISDCVRVATETADRILQDEATATPINGSIPNEAINQLQSALA